MTTMASGAMGELRSAYRGAWWSLVLRGLLSIAVGVFIMWRPVQSLAALALLVAFWAFVDGIVGIVHALDLRELFPEWWVLLLSGIVSVGFSIAAFYYYPAVSLAFIVVGVVCWMFMTGGLAIYLALREHRATLPGWGWTLAFGIVSVVVGAAAALNPPVTLVAFLGVLAGASVLRGAALLSAAYRLSTAKDDLAATFRPASPA